MKKEKGKKNEKAIKSKRRLETRCLKDLKVNVETRPKKEEGLGGGCSGMRRDER